MKKILSVFFLVWVSVAADESQDGFDLAPTPVSQTQVESGKTEKMARLTYVTSTLTANGTDFDITGVGAQVVKTDGKDEGATDLSGSFLFLSGSGGEFDATLVSGNVAYLWESYNKTTEGGFYTLFYGADFSYTYMNAYSSALEIDLYTKQYGGVLGLQYNIHTPDLIISPFGVAKYLMGDYEANAWYGGNYGYTSGDLDPMVTQAFGFDVYFKSVGSTLSATVKSDSASNTTMLSYAWRW